MATAGVEGEQITPRLLRSIKSSLSRKSFRQNPDGQDSTEMESFGLQEGSSWTPPPSITLAVDEGNSGSEPQRYQGKSPLPNEHLVHQEGIPHPDDSQKLHDDRQCRSELGKDRTERCCQFGKLFVVCVVFVVSYYFQVIDDYPMKVDIHQTNDTSHFENGTGGYTCGCSLPINVQSLEYVRTNGRNFSFNLNRCYDPSELKDINVVMFSNSSAELVQSIMKREVNTSKPMRGVMIEQQAHAVEGILNLPLDWYVPDEFKLNIKRDPLYPGGDRQSDLAASIGYFTSDVDFLSFPPDHLRLALQYCHSSDCSYGICVKNISDIFVNILGTERWGSCFRYENGDKLCNEMSYRAAKCTIYPPSTIPAASAAIRFLKVLSGNQNVRKILPIQIEDVSDWPNTTEVNISIQPSTVYVNHSIVRASEIHLRFQHVEPGSAPWLALSSSFPHLDASCSSFRNMSFCTDRSVCNLFRTGGVPDIRCLSESVLKDASLCRKVFSNSFTENSTSSSLCKDLGVTPSVEDPLCTCTEQDCLLPIPPYLANWNISSSVKDDPLNAFLYSKILKDEWAKRFGVCTNKYERVIPYNPGQSRTANESEYGRETLLLQGNCSEKENETNWKGMGSRNYCWLTGRYRNFTSAPVDTDWEEWKPLNISQFFDDEKSKGIFVCYRIRARRTYIWIILILGVSFGWAGSVDLAFQYIQWFRKESKGKS